MLFNKCELWGLTCLELFCTFAFRYGKEKSYQTRNTCCK
jgi:hypothetical protein